MRAWCRSAEHLGPPRVTSDDSLELRADPNGLRVEDHGVHAVSRQQAEPDVPGARVVVDRHPDVVVRAAPRDDDLVTGAFPERVLE